MDQQIPEDQPGTDAPGEDWVGPFKRALLLHGRPAGKQKWCIGWVRTLERRLQGRSLRQVTREDVDGFLGTLSTSPNVSAWQVDQAADSLRILIGSVFGQGWIRTVKVPVCPACPPPPPLVPGDDPVNLLRYAIRSRNYSMRTEKSYVFWVQRFLAFCRKENVEPGTDSVRAFLERLVISANV